MSREYTLQPAPRANTINIDYAAELNEQQLAAVTAPPGPLLVIAGAGSGKTRTLTYRVAYLLENGIDPRNILLLTFTNKAARQMLERVANLLPVDASGLWGGTFHSIGNRMLRRHGSALGYSSGFSIMDREDQKDLIDTVVAAAGINPKEIRFPKGDVLAEIFSFVINTETGIDALLAEKFPYFLPLLEQIKDVHARYEKKKKNTNSMDFDDLLEKTLRMLKEHEHIADFYRRQFQFILVDEYQDTNKIQADFIDTLAAEHRNVMVVGDDAQSIYSWRGANFKNILAFPERYPDAKVFKIELNYRSVPEILQVANAAIAANVKQFRKALAATRTSNAFKPAVVGLNDGSEQARFVAQRILELRDEGVELNDIAILYRAHYHAIELQLELSRRGIPYLITSGVRFFEQAHVKDVTSFIRFVANPRDEVAFKRMVKLLPGVGNKSADTYWRAFVAGIGDPGPETTSNPGNGLVAGGTSDPAGIADPGYRVEFGDLLRAIPVGAKSKKSWEQLSHTLDEIAPGGIPNPPSEMITSIVEAIYDDYAKANFTNYELRREDLNQLAAFARQFKDVDEFLSQLALISNIDSEPALDQSTDTEAVNLSSVHQAKGLEYHTVFVIWLTDGMFPSTRSLETRDTIEEERRLFYVAITRARDELYLTFPHMRLSGGFGDIFQRPSRFLKEIPNQLIEDWQIKRG
ncbi:MAG TPA: UvrD-helicase domain-containing protein [Chthoniobacterales bacterium]|jgi:DNA helicase-2/ATP-dependent DNA helicase PcrA|nr:UvrD-helicase domain-containing protein [Chthoniobacterales bacterium]